MHTCEQIIEEIIESMVGADTTTQQSYFIREMLRSLVRMARVEYADELKKAVFLLQSNPYSDFSAEESSERMTKKLLKDLQSRPSRSD